jgi:predicted anti-sigma-YlaC factor YlaD
MNEHLNADAMDRYAAGERDAAAEEHLRECAECREAAGRMETVLRQFRSTAQGWSESQPQSRPPSDLAARAQARESRGWVPPMRWAAVATAALALAAMPVYRNYSRHRAELQAQADTLLLEQVSADLSRPAPEALEPLVALVSQANTQSSNGENR